MDQVKCKIPLFKRPTIDGNELDEGYCFTKHRLTLVQWISKSVGLKAKKYIRSCYSTHNKGKEKQFCFLLNGITRKFFQF